MKWLRRRPKDLRRTKKLEVELTTRCPILCPMCPRSRASEHFEGWDVGALDVDILFALLRENPDTNLVLCGALGDPIYHPQFIEIMERLGLEFPAMNVYVETNGSLKSPQWWARLGQVTTVNHTFSFSIDGLEDTNRLYRRNATWSTLMSGIKVFRLLHRGSMQWKWIVFSHNEHQVVEGYRLSRELGFNQFKLISSQRHTDDSWPRKDFRELEEELAREERISSDNNATMF